MARVSTYLNFARSTAEAFNFYKSVFGTEFESPTMRFYDDSPQDMFWVGYFVSCTDKFGIHWMFNCSSKE